MTPIINSIINSCLLLQLLLAPVEKDISFRMALAARPRGEAEKLESDGLGSVKSGGRVEEA